MHEIRKIIDRNPATANRRLVFQEAIPLVKFKTNRAIICRILMNMILTAPEASQNGDTVKVRTDSDSRWIRFNVWNRQVIGKEIAKRIFQRNFSTKEAMGRGWGTYSMKLLGEKILNGSVKFRSSEKTGTTFQLSLPI